MATNNLVTNDEILSTALMEFENNLILGKVARRTYEKDFTKTSGNSIRVRRPTRYEARVGRLADIQAIDERYDFVTVGDMIGVDVEVTSQELALQLDDLNREIITPAMVTLANQIDSLLYGTTIDIYNAVGTAGSPPSSFNVINNACSLLNGFGVPQGKDRFCLVKSNDAGAVRNALYNTFNEKFNKEIILDGSMGNLASFDFYDVQNVIRPSSGSASLGTPAINGAGQSGDTLVIDGLTASVLINKGSIFTIAGINSLNPTSRQDTGNLAQFVVTANAQANLSGQVTLSIMTGNSRGITLTGPYRNVTSSPADNALLTFNATHNKNIAFHREAFSLSTVMLPVATDSGAWQKNIVGKTNINIRMTRQYQGIPDQWFMRFDILPAVKCFPEYACVVMGS